MSYLKEMAGRGYRMDAIGPFHRHMVPWLLSSYGIPKDASVMDMGAGQGHVLIPLHSHGWRNLTGVDMDDYNFKEFQSRYNIKTVRCDLSKEPVDLPDAAADVILSFHVIEHLPTPNNFLTECRRVLKPNGTLFLVTPDWRKQYKTFWRDPTHVRPYDKVSIHRLLKMFGFDANVFSWNAQYGMGRFQAYRWFPRLGMIGDEMLAVAKKNAPIA